jgi:hypothetical protein
VIAQAKACGYIITLLYLPVALLKPAPLAATP